MGLPLSDVEADILGAKGEAGRAAAHEALALAAAFMRIERLMPAMTRYDARTQSWRPVAEVRTSFRRKTGQWFVSCGPISAAKPSLAEAMREVADRMELLDIERRQS